MSFRIAHNVDAVGIHRSLDVSANRLATAMKRLSSGMRINSAADDAAGLGISERMRSQIRGLEQANRNIGDGISMLQTMEGALNEVHSILQRARELAVQWNNDTYSFVDKLGIRNEMFALSDEIARIEQATTFNGVALLQNANIAVTLQIGANSNEIVTVSMIDLFGPNVGNLVRPNTFFALPWVQADINGFDLHIDDVSAARSRIGSMVSRLEHMLSANEQTQQNLMSAESQIRDTDFAQELTAMTQQQVLQASGATMLIFAQRSPQRVLDLLQT